MQFADSEQLVERPVSASSADCLDWHGIDWARTTRNVRNLQVRIAQAAKEGDWRKVKALQRFLTRSFSGKAMAVRRVTENRGHKTAGVDKVLWSTPESKARGIAQLGRRGYQPLPLRRVYIPKSNGKLRPLGIPTMKDRAMQALHLLALEPVSETLADSNSYGFRPYRCAADAMKQCRTALSQRASAQWILEADIEGCFDHIRHSWLLEHIPMDRAVLSKWLKAGYVELNRLHATEEGTPQGGIISPTLANMTLDGLERLLTQRFGRRNSNKVNLIRYADDFIITGRSKELLENEAKPLVETFLAERGLRLSSAKTRITHVEEGFDFLGQNARKFKGKLIIKPSRKNVTAFMERVREIIRSNKAAKTVNLITLLNPVIKGWAEYHKTANAKETYSRVDNDVWYALWRWAKRRHPRKGLKWVKERYFTRQGTRNWVFAETVVADGKKVVVKLRRAAETRIVVHRKVEGALKSFPARMGAAARTTSQAQDDSLVDGAKAACTVMAGSERQVSGVRTAHRAR
jgi:RNA-directed DNA polymerase